MIRSAPSSEQLLLVTTPLITVLRILGIYLPLLVATPDTVRGNPLLPLPALFTAVLSLDFLGPPRWAPRHTCRRP